jgi:hypothetical protein
MAYFAVCILSTLIPLYGFILVRRYFSTKAALVVLVVGLFVSTIQMFTLYIGFWADIFAIVPAIASLFFFKELWAKKPGIGLVIFALLFSAAAIGHVWEALYSLFAIGVTILLVTLGKVQKHALTNLAIVFVLIIIFASTFVLKFNVVGYGEGEVLKLGQVREGPPDYFPKEKFGLPLLIGNILGVLVSIIMLVQKKMTQYQLAVAMLPIFLLVFVSSVYIGVESLHTYRQLYTAYFIFAIFPAIGIVGIIDAIKSAFPNRQIGKLIYPLVFGIILILLMANQFRTTYADLNQIKAGNAQRMPEWDSLMWLRDNTPKDAKTYPLWGYYQQGFFLFAERQTVEFPNDMNAVQSICEQKIPDSYNVSWYIHLYGSGKFKILNPEGTSYYVTPNLTEISQPKPIEAFDYVLVRYKGTQADPCMAYFLQNMTTRGHRVVWNDEYVAILEVAKNASG